MNSRRRLIVALMTLAALFALGASMPENPDCDATFGIEAWRAPGLGLLAATALIVGIVIAARARAPDPAP